MSTNIIYFTFFKLLFSIFFYLISNLHIGQVLFFLSQFKQHFQWNICPQGSKTVSCPFAISLKHIQQLGNSILPFLPFLQYLFVNWNLFNFFKLLSSVGPLVCFADSCWLLSIILCTWSKKSPLKLEAKFDEKLLIKSKKRI